jgi:hypothetical protein
MIRRMAVVVTFAKAGEGNPGMQGLKSVLRWAGQAPGEIHVVALDPLTM